MVLTRSFFKNTLNISFPALLNEGVWAFGITTYNSIYAHIGTEAIAAVNINSTIESMAFVIFIGSANAAAIMIGNKIGSGHEERVLMIMASGLSSSESLGRFSLWGSSDPLARADFVPVQYFCAVLFLFQPVDVVFCAYLVGASIEYDHFYWYSTERG